MTRSAVGLAAALFSVLAGNAWPQPQAAQELLDRAAAAYRSVDLDEAERLYLQVVHDVGQAGAGDAEARRLGAQAYLGLGRIAALRGRPGDASGRFREALERDRSAQIDGESDPPGIVKLFEQVRGTMPQVSDVPAGATPVPSPRQGAAALFEAGADFEAGVVAYKAVDLVQAERLFSRAAAAMHQVEQASPDATRLAARVHLYLGRVAAVAEKPDAAKAEFREALRRDPAITLDAESDPPKIHRLFDVVKAEPKPSPLAVVTPGVSSPTEPPVKDRRAVFAVPAGVVVVLLIAARRRRRARRAAAAQAGPGR